MHPNWQESDSKRRCQSSTPSTCRPRAPRCQSADPKLGYGTQRDENYVSHQNPLEVVFSPRVPGEEEASHPEPEKIERTIDTKLIKEVLDKSGIGLKVPGYLHKMMLDSHDYAKSLAKQRRHTLYDPRRPKLLRLKSSGPGLVTVPLNSKQLLLQSLGLKDEEISELFSQMESTPQFAGEYVREVKEEWQALESRGVKKPPEAEYLEKDQALLEKIRTLISRFAVTQEGNEVQTDVEDEMKMDNGDLLGGEAGTVLQEIDENRQLNPNLPTLNSQGVTLNAVTETASSPQHRSVLPSLIPVKDYIIQHCVVQPEFYGKVEHKSKYSSLDKRWYTVLFPALQPVKREDAQLLGEWLQHSMHKNQYETQDGYFEDPEAVFLLHSIAFLEIVRQVDLHCEERGNLLLHVWRQTLRVFNQVMAQAEPYLDSKEDELLHAKNHMATMQEQIDQLINQVEESKKQVKDKEMQMQKIKRCSVCLCENMTPRSRENTIRRVKLKASLHKHVVQIEREDDKRSEIPKFHVDNPKRFNAHHDTNTSVEKSSTHDKSARSHELSSTDSPNKSSHAHENPHENSKKSDTLQKSAHPNENSENQSTSGENGNNEQLNGEQSNDNVVENAENESNAQTPTDDNQLKNATDDDINGGGSVTSDTLDVIDNERKDVPYGQMQEETIVERHVVTSDVSTQTSEKNTETHSIRCESAPARMQHLDPNETPSEDYKQIKQNLINIQITAEEASVIEERENYMKLLGPPAPGSIAIPGTIIGASIDKLQSYEKLAIEAVDVMDKLPKLEEFYYSTVQNLIEEFCKLTGYVLKRQEKEVETTPETDILMESDNLLKKKAQTKLPKAVVAKFFVPSSFSKVMKINSVPKNLKSFNIRQVSKLLGSVYCSKIEADAIDDAANNERQSCSEFMYDFMLNLYGLKGLAESAIHGLFKAIKGVVTSKQMDKHHKVRLFSKFVGMEGEGFLESDLYLYLKLLQRGMTRPGIILPSEQDDGILYLNASHIDYIVDEPNLVKFLGSEEAGLEIIMNFAAKHTITEKASPEIKKLTKESEVRKIDWDHLIEAILESRPRSEVQEAKHEKKVEEKKPLTQEKLQELVNLFIAGDANQDGVLTFTEFREIIKTANPSISTQTALRIFRETLQFMPDGGDSISPQAFATVAHYHDISAPPAVVFALLEKTWDQVQGDVNEDKLQGDQQRREYEQLQKSLLRMLAEQKNVSEAVNVFRNFVLKFCGDDSNDDAGGGQQDGENEEEG